KNNRGKGRDTGDNLLLERQNDIRLEELASKVTTLHRVTVDIHDNVIGQNAMIDTSTSTFGRFKGMLGTTQRRLKRTINTANTKHMCYMILALVIGFFLLLQIAKYLTSRVSSQDSAE
ncbi:hypothetical protein EV182_001210, partial [Spiromyces aspiralis]